MGRHPLEPQLRQQPLEPGILPAGLHPYPHLLPRQRAIKLFRLLAVLQSFLLNLSRSVVKDRDLLKPWMKITAYNQHDVGSFSRALVLFCRNQSTRCDEPTSLCNQPEPFFRRREGSCANRVHASGQVAIGPAFTMP
jgi:hypothetical protein